MSWVSKSSILINQSFDVMYCVLSSFTSLHLTTTKNKTKWLTFIVKCYIFSSCFLSFLCKRNFTLAFFFCSNVCWFGFSFRFHSVLSFNPCIPLHFSTGVHYPYPIFVHDPAVIELGLLPSLPNGHPLLRLRLLPHIRPECVPSRPRIRVLGHRPLRAYGRRLRGQD